MISNEIRDAIREWFFTELLDDTPSGELTDDMDLRDNGILDSLSSLRLVDFVEGRFDIEVDVDEAGPNNFGNIDRIVRYISGKTNGAQSANGTAIREGK